MLYLLLVFILDQIKQDIANNNLPSVNDVFWEIRESQTSLVNSFYL